MDKGSNEAYVSNHDPSDRAEEDSITAHKG